MKRLFKKRDLTFLPAIALILTVFMLLSAVAYGISELLEPLMLFGNPWSTQADGTRNAVNPNATTLPVPRNFRITSTGNCNISGQRLVNLAWDHVNDAQFYRIT